MAAGVARQSRGTQYWHQTRRATVSLAFLLPLLALYEFGVAQSGGSLRNSAELSLKDLGGFLGPAAVWVGRMFLALTLVLMFRLWRREVPVLGYFPWMVLEALLWAVLAIAALVLGSHSLGLEVAVGEPAGTREEMLLSLGAGVYEELAFRFLLLAGGFSALRHGLGLERSTALGIAWLASAVAFSVYHHVGPFGEPWNASRLMFRAGAGIILGAVFLLRGLAVCAYLHAFYDLLLDLQRTDL